MAIQVNDNNFQEKVLQSDNFIIVHFMAIWSGPCRMLRQTLGNLSEEYAERLYIYELDSDDSPDTYSKYSIRVVPTLLFFKRGEVVEKIEGLEAESQLKRILGLHI